MVALQVVERVIRGPRDAENLQAVSGRLAAAVEADGAKWRYGLSYARDEAVYARVNGLAPAAAAELGAGVFKVSAALPIDAEVGAKSVGLGALALRAAPYALELGPWGIAAAVGVLGVGVGVYLYMKGMDQSEGDPDERFTSRSDQPIIVGHAASTRPDEVADV